MTEPSVYDHYRFDGTGGAGGSGEADCGAGGVGAVAPGVYRVVGSDEERVTLLRVADGDGRRVNSGRVERVPPDGLGSSFRPAGNPDAGFSPLGTLAGMADGLWWGLRSLLGR